MCVSLRCVKRLHIQVESCVYDGEGVSYTYLHILPLVPDTVSINVHTLCGHRWVGGFVAAKELGIFGDFNTVAFCLEVYESTVLKALTDNRTLSPLSGLPLMNFNIDTPGPQGDGPLCRWKQYS